MRFTTQLSNYYGTVEFDQRGDRFVMVLENHDGEREVEISKDFYLAARKEFCTDENLKGFPHNAFDNEALFT